MTEVPSDAPKPRLCHIVQWSDFDGYGFNLHADKSRPGQYIGKIDDHSPAEASGLREGDRIVEVNGVNISHENHKQVVERIKSVPNETKLLVLDSEADKWYKTRNLVVRGDQSNIIHGTSESRQTDDIQTSNSPTSSPIKTDSNSHQNGSAKLSYVDGVDFESNYLRSSSLSSSHSTVDEKNTNGLLNEIMECQEIRELTNQDSHSTSRDIDSNSVHSAASSNSEHSTQNKDCGNVSQELGSSANQSSDNQTNKIVKEGTTDCSELYQIRDEESTNYANELVGENLSDCLLPSRDCSDCNVTENYRKESAVNGGLFEASLEGCISLGEPVCHEVSSGHGSNGSNVSLDPSIGLDENFKSTNENFASNDEKLSFVDESSSGSYNHGSYSLKQALSDVISLDSSSKDDHPSIHSTLDANESSDSINAEFKKELSIVETSNSLSLGDFSADKCNNNCLSSNDSVVATCEENVLSNESTTFGTSDAFETDVIVSRPTANAAFSVGDEVNGTSLQNAQAVTVQNGSISPESVREGSKAAQNGGSETNGGLNFNMSAAEMRARLASKKKFDPRKDNSIDLKKKYQIIQNM